MGRSLFTRTPVGAGPQIGQQASIPVDWRIQLTRRWTDDPLRRERAYIPPSVRAQSDWQYAVDLVEQVGEWGMARAPVVGDLRHTAGARQLMTKLAELGADFVFEVSDALEVVPGPHLAAVRSGYGPQRGPNLVRARDCLRGADITHRQVL